MATLTAQLSGLEATSLISLVRTEPDLEYSFRHALIQEAAYDSLLKSERQSLHLAAGEVLENVYEDRLEEIAPRLADHFWEAGDKTRARIYSIMAAVSAARSYANQEAIMHYTRALNASIKHPEEQASILQARGELYETMGEFEQARLDQESSLAIARAAGDARIEWQGLINLGALWAARDYHKTGSYYRSALKLARKIQDAKLLGHSLNRLANVYTNIEEPDKSQSLHKEALSIFNQIGDSPGIAETKDFLGMAYALAGDAFESKKYLEQAVDLFRELGDQRGMASSLATLSLTTFQAESDTLVITDTSPEEGTQIANNALEISRSIGWRSGEVFSLATLSLNQISLGQYDQAMHSVNLGFEIIEQIHHRQWETFLRFGRGALYLDLFAFPEARQELEIGLATARENHSGHWVHACAGLLATVLITEGQLESAERLLDEFLPSITPMQTPGQRLGWKARAELALGQGNPEKATDIIQELINIAAKTNPNPIIPLLNLLLAESFMALAQKPANQDERSALLGKAEEVLLSALKEMQEKNYFSKIWRVYAALRKGYQLQGREPEERQAARQAREFVSDLAKNIRDPKLHESFLQHANS